MMRECPCSTKTREGLENPSPPPSRFPLAMGFAPLDPREIPQVSGCKTHGRGKSLKISLDPRDFPRASPSGNLSGLGKSWASGMDFPIPPSSWWSTDTVRALSQVPRPTWQVSRSGKLTSAAGTTVAEMRNTTPPITSNHPLQYLFSFVGLYSPLFLFFPPL